MHASTHTHTHTHKHTHTHTHKHTQVEGDDRAMNQRVLKTLTGMESDLLRRDVVLYIQMELCHNRTLGHWIADYNANVLRKKKVRVCIF